MRILHLLHQYLPEKVGGTELYTRTLAQHQAQQGHEVSIFTPASQPQPPSREEGVMVHRVGVGQRGATAVFAATFRHPSLHHAFSQLLQQNPPDLVHIQHLMGLPLSLVRQIPPIPYVITLHDYWYVCANAQLLTNTDQTVCQGPNWWLNCAHCALARVGQPNAWPLIPAVAPVFAYRHQQLQRVLAGAAALIAPTQFTARLHQQMGIAAAKIHVIAHGIERPFALPQRPLSPETLGLHVAYIGGLAWQKGVHVLLEAVNQLPDELIRLSIWGDETAFPDYVAGLKQQAHHPGIQFNGRLPHAHLWETLAGVDLVVLPTLWYETASLIVQEAFAAGLPVLASDIGALRERVQEGVDGRLFPPGDSRRLAHLLRQLAQNPAQLAHLRQGIQPVRTIQQHLAEMEGLYKQLVFLPSSTSF